MSNMKWIKTSEHDPEESGNYLIIVDGKVEMEYYSPVLGWDCDPDCNMTHWMPIPDPPEEVET